jgi:DNA-binding NarL/FixJ family response regulator
MVMRLSAFADLIVSETVDSPADVIITDAAEISRSGAPVIYLVRDGGEAAQAIARGARGVLPRTAPPRKLHAAIHAAAEGVLVIDEEIAEYVVPHARARVDLIEPLTAREQQVAQLLAGGLTNKEIAQRLEITEHTVKFHLNGILRKLGVSTRTEAVVQAARLGILIL